MCDHRVLAQHVGRREHGDLAPQRGIAALRRAHQPRDAPVAGAVRTPQRGREPRRVRERVAALHAHRKVVASERAVIAVVVQHGGRAREQVAQPAEEQPVDERHGERVDVRLHLRRAGVRPLVDGPVGRARAEGRQRREVQHVVRVHERRQHQAAVEVDRGRALAALLRGAHSAPVDPQLAWRAEHALLATACAREDQAPGAHATVTRDAAGRARVPCARRRRLRRRRARKRGRTARGARAAATTCAAGACPGRRPGGRCASRMKNEVRASRRSARASAHGASARAIQASRLAPSTGGSDSSSVRRRGVSKRPSRAQTERASETAALSASDLGPGPTSSIWKRAAMPAACSRRRGVERLLAQAAASRHPRRDRDVHAAAAARREHAQPVVSALEHVFDAQRRPPAQRAAPPRRARRRSPRRARRRRRSPRPGTATSPRPCRSASSPSSPITRSAESPVHAAPPRAPRLEQ